MKQRIDNVLIGGSLHRLTIENGRYAAVESSGSHAHELHEALNANDWDAQGLQFLPAFIDYHCHLDKTFVGEGWRSRKPFVTFTGQLETEKALHATLAGTVLDRARLLAEQMLDYGTTRVRTHVDIDPVIGLRQLEDLVRLKEELKDRMEIEIVAFPQQGLLRSRSVPLIREALRSGANLVGSVDPGGLDGQVEANLSVVYELSSEFDADVDIHLHDFGHLGLYTVERIIDYTASSAMQGRVAISHAWCLGQITADESARIAERLREQQITIVSSVPLNRPIPNLPQLEALGVKVRLGTDDVVNAWTPFGNGDMLERASRMAELFSLIEDDQLAGAYRFITDAPLVPKLGEQADFVLVDAMNEQHALASVAPRELVYSRGQAVAGRRHRRVGRLI